MNVFDDLVATLRSFEGAYSEKFFRPLTEEDDIKLDAAGVRAASDRISAEMGRYLTPYMLRAADEIERLRTELALLKSYQTELANHFGCDPHEGRAWMEDPDV